MGVAKWESFLENKIEGFFHKKFPGVLEPIEIIRGLEREAERNAQKREYGVFVPCSYDIALNAEDYQKLCAKRVQDAFYLAVAKHVVKKNFFLEGTLKIHLRKDAAVTQNTFAVQSSFAVTDATDPPRQDEGTDTVEPHTLVLNHNKFPVPLNLPPEYKTVSLTVTAGPDVGSYLEFGEKQVYIGRRDKSDFIITDESVSRLHAYIDFENYRHILHDASSLNGTFVNGEKISVKLLCVGDEIGLGNTTLVYDVLTR